MYCTSTKKDNLIDDAYYKLDKEKYNFDKESFVSLYEIKTINKDQYIKKLNTLSDSDFSKLKKLVKVKTNNKTMKKNYLRAKIFKNKIDLYDIISVQDKLYYIYDIEGKYYKCYKISKHSKCKHPITINGTIYSFDFNNKEKIKKEVRLN